MAAWPLKSPAYVLHFLFAAQIDEHAELMKEKLDLDKERVVRTPDEMAAEAAELRALFI